MTSPSYVRWIQNKKPGQEHATFSNFVHHFKLVDKELATKAYQRFIDSDAIRKVRRARLQKQFDDFQANRESTFWSQRRLEISSEITANDAGVTSQRVGRIQSQIGYSRFLLKSSGYLFDESLHKTEGKRESLSHVFLNCGLIFNVFSG